MEIEYAPERIKITINKDYVDYRYDTLFIDLPMLVTNDKHGEIVVLGSNTKAKCTSPLPTFFIGRVEFPVGHTLSKDAKDSEIWLKIEVSYERLKKIEEYRLELPKSECLPDLTLVIEGEIVYALKSDQGLDIRHENIEVKQGRQNFLTIRDVDWNEVLEGLGYPKLRQILVQEEIWNEIENYRKSKNIPNIEDAIYDAILKAKRPKQE